MSALRKTSIPRALHRPNLVLGAEREPVLITAILCAGVSVSALNLVGIGVGIGVWLIAALFLRMMAKADPYMSKVYLRQLAYPPYLPARSRPTRKD
jgi:type IV secretion system protein VirB3